MYYIEFLHLTNDLWRGVLRDSNHKVISIVESEMKPDADDADKERFYSFLTTCLFRGRIEPR